GRATSTARTRPCRVRARRAKRTSSFRSFTTFIEYPTGKASSTAIPLDGEARVPFGGFGISDGPSQHFRFLAFRADVADARRLDEDEDLAAAAVAGPLDARPLVHFEVLRFLVELAHPFDLLI